MVEMAAGAALVKGDSFLSAFSCSFLTLNSKPPPFAWDPKTRAWISFFLAFVTVLNHLSVSNSMALDYILGFGIITIVFGFLFWISTQKKEGLDAGNKVWRILDSLLRLIFLTLTLIGCLGIIVFGMQSASGTQIITTNYTYANFTVYTNATQCTNGWFNPVLNKCVWVGP